MVRYDKPMKNPQNVERLPEGMARINPSLLMFPTLHLTRVLIVLLATPFLWAQAETGTVTYIEWWKTDLLTFAADSRSVRRELGDNADERCKISAFGSQFVFMAGGFTAVGVNADSGWDAHAIARQVWQTEHKSITDASKLVSAVADKWTVRMEELYRKPGVVEDERKNLPEGADPVLIGAFFAATDPTGGMAVKSVEIFYDLKLLDSTGKVKLLPKQDVLHEDHWNVDGDKAVVLEFKNATSARAAEYMRWFAPQLSKVPVNEQRAAYASKFIELSILLHPRNFELGFPIDVLQLHRKTGVVWVSRKSTCPVD